MTDFGGAIKKTDKYEIAILGIPYDEKSSYLKGTSLGPRAIREASTSEMINAWTELDVNLEEDINIVDLGDLSLTDSESNIFNKIEEEVYKIIQRGVIPVILGGDHSITYPIVKAFSRKYKTLDILHFDAHPDLYDELYGDPLSHACPFARIMEKGLANNLVQIGIRAKIDEHVEKAKKYNIKMIEMKDFRDDILLEFHNPLYISFDLDSLDPAFAPGVSHHEPGGLTTRQVIKIIHNLKANIVGMDVVELNPKRDLTGITASAAVKVIMEIMGKIVLQRKNK
ncbi:agmatinase [Candidatus Aminicenantes bacterium AC-335-K20]|jgi:agmatinase|nr:agmatinase [SCandidatus Aminicenantes bacterium Aminicenantia_JdfR_composite]MCP2619195.1 agmatinase [Candidatus Aminicenantes bacterium AC-335-K20]MCP2620949.1 agmatinase [Candidatus Aminicenantes bacterium AC-334-E05]